MAEGLSSNRATAILNAIFNNTSYAESAIWVQLHTGAPGAAGTANVATETTRKDVTAAFSTAVSNAVTNDVAVSWTSVAGTEDFTHISLWTAVSAGTFILSGTITANSVTAGDNFTLPIGDIDSSFAIAS